MTNLKELIELIPLILSHIAPGHAFYSVIQYQIGNKTKDYKYMLFNSAILSFFINSIVGIFISTENKWFSIIAISMGVITALILITVIEEKWLADIAFKLNLYKAAKEDLINDIVDSKLGMWLYVYIGSEQVIYLGKLVKYEDTTEDGHRYILLSEYSCYTYQGEEIKTNDDDHTKCVLINIANIDRIEIIYDENSKKIQKPKKRAY